MHIYCSVKKITTSIFYDALLLFFLLKVGIAQLLYVYFIECLVLQEKNPAYRRHRISRPLRLVAPIFLSPGVDKGD